MKREIKFRGKDLKTGKWVCGSLLQDDYGNCCIVTFIDHHETWYDVQPETIGQFTGLHDRNGKEIYEGDYLEACFKYDDISSDGCVIPDQDCIVHGVVEWDDCGLCIKIQDCEYPLNKEFGNGELGYLSFAAFQSPEDDIEVKGNIHELNILSDDSK